MFHFYVTVDKAKDGNVSQSKTAQSLLKKKTEKYSSR